MVGRAIARSIVSINTTDPREFATDVHRTVDDSPYGGGPGMLMKAEPVAQAIDTVKTENSAIVMTDPTGKTFKQSDAEELCKKEHLIFVCGHYEGIDDRVAQEYATHVYSIGDFVLTSGELAALVMADAIVRLLPGVLGSSESLSIDSHSDGLLSSPQYTRPEVWRERPVPPVLLSGNHEEIRKWKRRQSLLLTRSQRPDLFAKAAITTEDLKLMQQKGLLPEEEQP